MKKNITLFVCLGFILFFLGCKKPIQEVEKKADAEFSYATTKDLTLNLKFLSSENKPLKYILVNFYYPDSKNTTDAVFTALTDSNGVLHGNFAAPAYKTALIIDLKYPGISRNITKFLENNSITVTIKATGTAVSKNARTLGTDTDGDGVDDAYDEFPNDIKRAYTKYYPSKNTWGTLAFEDNWPYKGDYDMNDLVVKYNYAIVCDYRGFYMDIDCNYKVQAAGASNTNGFGVTLPYIGVFTGGVTPIASVTGQKLTENYVKLGPGGFDDQGVNIMPFDNHRSIFGGISGPINAVNGVPKLASDVVTVKVKFKYPVDHTLYSGKYYTSRVGFSLYDVPFNPFMVCKMKPRYEVHQIGYAPSWAASDAGIRFLYGTGDDSSVPELYAEFPSGLYRTKDGGKPWVINFAEDFDYPVENASISQTYLHFDEWRAGLGYSDWYLDKPGYRNQELVYK